MHIIMSNTPQQERPGQQFSHDLSFEEDCQNAQRAAVETLHIGRATLEQVHQQGEQLDRAESIADETQYRLDKAGRILRGMTWSGWLANKFTKDIGPPPAVTRSTPIAPPLVYENVPDSCRAAAQAIQNYHANVKVLEACETDEQRETLLLICQSMYSSAMTQLDELEKNRASVEAYVTEFRSHLTILHEKEQSLNQSMRQQKISFEKNRAELLKGHSNSSTSSATDAHLQLQENHLDMISKSLGEIGMISHTLASAIGQQAQTIDSLDEKADHITEKSRMVTRRADRLIQNKSWTPVKPTFACHVSIRHLESGRYLSVHEGNLVLQTTFHESTGVFSLWKRQGEIFGLKNKESGRWLGQSMLGGISCSAYDFGRREEWEADSDWGKSRLLCTSVGWGAGGYLLVNTHNLSVRLGGCGVEERKTADLWCITNLDTQEDS
ncbi:hypothetical protein FisN_4Hh543 [Fistulifera solaris]|uniref:t-SNARE coiled-coil homology domain-containing protein n=1 Tax=Fistulifera solaris TaxID=1519565 RepID=A0A1Z5KI40_FISSO|nr:hypothetical protein FisN_4Hh543 [Fistulifera solaris]|eukprot:GAX25973.1 hypothetical protein FisN_4Hh543 [Fistulifera solaris]